MSATPNKAKDIFLAALEAEPARRVAVLDELCAGDAELRNHVESLLRSHDVHDSFLDSPRINMVLPPGTDGLGDDRTLDCHVSESPGARIGPYKLLQKIGDGGMGVVYMARQTEPVQRLVALKIIKPGMDTRQVIARFEAERHALALMDHPNIARVLDADTTDSGRPYFVMELVKGVPITQYCDEHKLTLTERLELFIPVCHAVQHAHQKGIIHRDLKPSNVLVAEYDDRPVPKIIDFGVAKAVNQQLTQRTMFTQLGQVVGTIDSMSPEQAKLNELDVDTRSDIYSLGVLLYELLTGETPFDRLRLHSAAFDELLRIIREEEPPKPSTRLSASKSLPGTAASRRTEPRKLSALIRGELDWIVMKAMEKERSRRYDTANAFAADIEHYLKDEPVIACPESAGYRFRKFVVRNQRWATSAAVIGLVLVVASLVSTWQAVRATTARDDAETAERVAQTERSNAQRRADEASAARLEAEQAAAEAQAVAEFLVNDLLGSTAPDQALARDVTVKEALAKLEQKIGTAFKDHPRREAAARYRIGWTYCGLGQWDLADRHLRRALQLRTGLLGPDHPDTVRSALGILESQAGRGRQYWDTDRRPEAHRLWQRVLPDLHALGIAGPKHEWLQRRVIWWEREICRRYGLMGLWDLAAWLPSHNAALKRVTDYANDLDFAVLLAVVDQDTWRAYCQHAASLRRAPSPHFVRTSLLLVPPAVNPDQCIGEAAEVVEQRARDPRWLYFPQLCVALAQYRAGRHADALRTVESTRKLTPGPELLAAYLGALAGQAGGGDSYGLSELLRAEELYQKTCKSQLAPGLKELAPPLTFFWDLAAAQVLRREAWQKIQGSAPPPEPWWRLIQARGYGLLAESERAGREFAAAVAATPDDPEVWLTRARLFEQLGQHAPAEADREKAAQLGTRPRGAASSR